MEDYFGLIYKAENLINKKIYIGQTTESLNTRISKHISDKRGYYFHNALHKYGKENFKFTILCEIYCKDQELLNNTEKFFINYYNSFKNGYNLTTGGNQYIMSETTKNKISKSKKQYKFTEEHKKNISIATKQAMSNIELKQYLSKKKKELFLNMNDEQYKKYCESHKGINKGIKKPPRTKEHLYNIKIAQIKRYENEFNNHKNFILSLNKNDLITFMQKNVKDEQLRNRFYEQFNYRISYTNLRKILIEIGCYYV